MKKSLGLLVVAMVLNVSFASASDLKIEKSYVKTNQEFARFLEPSFGNGELENDVIVKVRVYVTANNEIVVLQTNTENVELANYIKETLNYKKLTSDELVSGRNYVFNVNFKA